MNRKETAVRQNIVEIGRRLYQKGYIAGTEGNISIRITKNEIIITPAGFPKGNLQPKNLIKIDLAGKKIKGPEGSLPSSETAMHLAIYKSRTDVKAVIHAHPPFATGFSVARVPLPKKILPELILTLGEIPLSEYATPTTQKLAKAVSKLIINHDAVLLANHGIVCVGKNIDDAYYKIELVEHFAKICFIARLLGKETELETKEIKELLKLKNKVYS